MLSCDRSTPHWPPPPKAGYGLLAPSTPTPDSRSLIVCQPGGGWVGGAAECHRTWWWRWRFGWRRAAEACRCPVDVDIGLANGGVSGLGGLCGEAGRRRWPLLVLGGVHEQGRDKLCPFVRDHLCVFLKPTQMKLEI